MNVFMRRGFCCLSVWAFAASPASALTITTINLEWFGLNGSPSHDTGSETRVDSMRQHLVSQGLMADVMVFEEVVDVPLLQRDLVGSDYGCQSYVRADAKHQHVVLCVKSPLRLMMSDEETNFELENIDVNGHLRPAVHGIVTDARGHRLVHIFGVHLKAMPDQSAMRMTQVQRLADYIEQNVQDPVVILGDFNTYGSDPEDMATVFARAGLTEVDVAEPFTWASAGSGYNPAKFDRVWVSDGLNAQPPSRRVVGPCSSGDDALIAAYNHAVSDHCAVNFEFVASQPAEL